jgi:hypothetical protein
MAPMLRVLWAVFSQSATGPLFGAARRSSANSGMPLAASVASRLSAGAGAAVKFLRAPPPERDRLKRSLVESRLENHHLVAIRLAQGRPHGAAGGFDVSIVRPQNDLGPV